MLSSALCRTLQKEVASEERERDEQNTQLLPKGSSGLEEETRLTPSDNRGIMDSDKVGSILSQTIFGMLSGGRGKKVPQKKK